MIGIPIILIVLGISATSIVYYRKKLQKPIIELKAGIAKIQNDDLDFTISYNYPDELGDLCISMEKMRSELRKKNRRIWKLLEERRLLNASVAHDLRTPITVIKGYLDYLCRSILQEKLTRQEETETLQYMREATDRLEKYVDSIRDVEAIENMEALPQEETKSLFDEMESNIRQLAHQGQKTISVNVEFSENKINLDTTIIAPITSVPKKKFQPTHIFIDYDFLESRSVVLLEQIRTIDKQRLSDYLGQVSQEDMQKIEGSIAISLGMKENKPEARNE